MANVATTSILGKAETDFSKAVAGSDRLAADKETFLKLLVAQLTHQDPLNPTEDKEFITQLAQFTSLEQLQSINAGVETLNTTMNQGQMISATSFIGKSILGNGSQITKLSDDTQIGTTPILYTLDSGAAKGQVNIFDTNGNLVYSENIPAVNAGTYSYTGWKGYNSAGKEVPDGVYTAVFTFQDANDKAVMPKTQCVGKVVGVENSDGTYKLVLADGRTVKFTDVNEVYEGTSTSTKTYTPEEQASEYAALALEYQGAAEAQLAKAQAATTKTEAETAATNAAAAAKSAKEAAEAAQKVADNASTASARSAAKASASKAAAAATDAQAAADAAKARAEAFA